MPLPQISRDPQTTLGVRSPLAARRAPPARSASRSKAPSRGLSATPSRGPSLLASRGPAKPASCFLGLAEPLGDSKRVRPQAAEISASPTRLANSTRWDERGICLVAKKSCTVRYLPAHLVAKCQRCHAPREHRTA